MTFVNDDLGIITGKNKLKGAECKYSRKGSFLLKCKCRCMWEDARVHIPFVIQCIHIDSHGNDGSKICDLDPHWSDKKMNFSF